MKIKANVGTADRTIRLIIALVLIVLFYTGILPSIYGIIGLVLALLLTITSLLSFCPIYKLLGASSVFKKNQSRSSEKIPEK
ncbi:MAG: YgaP family membrane protein [Paludibacteraceae bacterium]